MLKVEWAEQANHAPQYYMQSDGELIRRVTVSGGQEKRKLAVLGY